MQTNKKEKKKNYNIILYSILLAVLLMLVVLLKESLSLSSNIISYYNDIKVYQDKIEMLKQTALSDTNINELSGITVENQNFYVAFISICDKQTRAKVFSGKGESLESALNNADKEVQAFLSKNSYDLEWIKLDIVNSYDIINEQRLIEMLESAKEGYFHYGISFDDNFDIALMEAELNGSGIYDYYNDGINIDYLNRYLGETDKSLLTSKPDNYIMFQTAGWFCNEDNVVYKLFDSGTSYGRREVENIDADYIKARINDASDFLINMVKEDGSFVYGIYPQFDNIIDNYNILRHAGTVWSLICQYKLEPSNECKETIDKTVDYLMENIVYRDAETAYVYEAKDDEIKLGGSGIAIVALTEYMDVFQTDKYVDVCKALGNGIISLQNIESGEFYHILNGDFSNKEKYRTVYYDGEATFALCRLYGLTGDKRWLDAAELSVKHFIEADYTQYRDHWVAYSMNEITKYIDNPDYYAFALRNAQENLRRIYKSDSIVTLESLMATFETYNRMIENNISVDYLESEFRLHDFLDTIQKRVDRLLDSFFFPEYAMYMENPQHILNTFMVPVDGFRIRIDDVQHSIGGFYQYYKNYDKLQEYIK